MTNQLVVADKNSMIEQVIIKGDLLALKPEERVAYYNAVCQSIGLNPLTQPFQYITLNGRLTLYARKDCTDQLRELNGVSITKLETQVVNEIYMVTAYGVDKTGRTDSSIGAVNIGGVKGDNLANAFMKAETKAKRRLTLSICGLGMLDETEAETIPGAAYPEQTTRVESVTVSVPDPVQAEPTPTPWPGDYGLTIPDMPLEMANGEKDHAQKPYAEIDTDKLLFMADTMATMIKTGKKPRGAKLTDEEVQDYYRKIAAAKAIVISRQQQPHPSRRGSYAGRKDNR